ncbi:MAG: RIP metalloprotease RseP [bacterium]
MLISILSFAVVFTIIAVTHELGHLIYSKRNGIRVHEFGLGFGPRLFAHTYKGTIYSLNLIPILAFVRIAGESDDKDDVDCPLSESYISKTPWQKFQAIAAGPFLNIIAAMLILSALFLVTGIPAGLSNEIGIVSKDSPADLAGLKSGDKLLAINGQAFPKMEEAISFIHKSGGKKLSLSIERAGKNFSVYAVPKYNEKMKVSLLGFTANAVYKRVNPLSAIYHGITQALSMVAMTIFIVWRLFTGGVSLSDIAGPIGIAQITGKYAQTGLVSLLYFTAFISANIGVINLLPLPALDGGRLVFVLLEVIRRKPLSPQLEMKINQWGMLFLLALMALVSFNDILRLFKH